MTSPITEAIAMLEKAQGYMPAQKPENEPHPDHAAITALLPKLRAMEAGEVTEAMVEAGADALGLKWYGTRHWSRDYAGSLRIMARKVLQAALSQAPQAVAGEVVAWAYEQYDEHAEMWFDEFSQDHPGFGDCVRNPRPLTYSDIHPPASETKIVERAKPLFKAETTAYTRNADPEAEHWALVYGDAPVRNDDDSTSHALRFPVLVIPEHVSESRRMASKVAEILNKHWPLTDREKKAKAIRATAQEKVQTEQKGVGLRDLKAIRESASQKGEPNA